MDVAPIKPQAPHRPPAPRPAPAGGAKRPSRAAAAPATPGDLALLAQQSQFDAMIASQAEQQREMNVLRDMAMQQVKRDDSTMSAWIKLI
jgi:hypothetical protein